MSDKKSEPGPIAIIIGSPIAVIIAAPNILLKAAVLRDLWNWFVLPFGAPVIGYWHFVGLMSLLAILVMRSQRHDTHPWYVMTAGMLCVWMIGAFAHWMMGNG